MTRMLRVLLLAMTVLTTLAGSGSAEGERTAIHLTTVHWRLASMDGTAVPAHADVELVFAIDGRVSGSGGCNELDGTWSYLGDDRISMSGFAATRTSCPGARGRDERRFIDHLILVTTFAIDGRKLTLTTTEGDRLVFQARGRTGSELVGDWALTAVGDAPAADLPRSTLSIDAGGTLTGVAGCNTFRARYAIEGTTIRVRRLLAGLGTCADHVMAQEVGFLAALEAGGAWSVDGDTLTIRDARDRPAVTLRAIRPVMHSLTGTDWTIATISEGAMATADTTIRFGEDGTLSGWAGCNTYSGPWTLDDDGVVLHIGPLLSTRTRCAWNGPDLEAAYLATLEDVIGYKTPDGAALWLNTASGVRITYAPPVTPTLTGTNWHLAKVGDTPFDGLAPVNLTFAEDGSFVGNGGCDLIHGSYEVRGDAFRIIDLDSGERACDAAVSEVQETFLGLLPMLDRMAFEGQDLLLSTGDQSIRFSP